MITITAINYGKRHPQADMIDAVCEIGEWADDNVDYCTETGMNHAARLLNYCVQFLDGIGERDLANLFRGNDWK